jgi:positive regulator of sigma E activity
MNKLAEVLESNSDGTARIVLFKHQKCSGCGMCNHNMHPGSIITADNPVNAGEGDMVSVNVQKKFSLKPLIFQYAMPVAIFFAGLGLGSFVFPSDQGGWKAMLFAFLLLVVALGAAFKFSKSYRPVYKAKIIKRA